MSIIICNHRDLKLCLKVTIYLLLFYNPVCLLQSDGFLKDNSNAAQRLLDGVNLVAQSVSELSVKPAKAVTSWLTDQIAPSYWKPNSLILVSDTHSPTLCHPPPTAKSTLSCPEGCLQSGVLCLLHNLMFAGHKIKLVWTQIASSSGLLMVNNTLLLLLFSVILCFSCTRCATSVTQSSRTTTPNITAVPAGRASATAALPKLRPCPREAGVSPLSESVTSASSREPRMQVYTHSH